MNFRFAMPLLLAAAVWPQHKLAPLDESGYRAMLKSNAGSVVLVDFWATWCAPCRKEMPLLAKLDGRLRQKRFHLITVSADESDKHFMGDFGAGIKFYPKGSFFVRPEAKLYLVNNNLNFSSARITRFGLSIGYTFGGH